MGWRAFGRQHNVMKSNLLSSLKRKIYNECFLPVLTCGTQRRLGRPLFCCGIMEVNDYDDDNYDNEATQTSPTSNK